MTQKTKNEGKLADSSSAPEIQKQKTKRKKKSIAIPKLEVDLFNQMLISSEVDATQKFTQISKGKSVVEPSNDTTDQMDVDFLISWWCYLQLSVFNCCWLGLRCLVCETFSQAMAIHFPEVILVDILSRLPVQSLLRFKCVSKFWEMLISEPYFKKKHFNRAKNDQDSQKFLNSQKFHKNGIVSMYCRPLSPVQLFQNVQKLDCPLNPTPLQCIIHCCYDGLAVIEVSDNLDGEHSTLLLWNPSTRESIVLPSPEFPEERSPSFGLGYDSSSGEYKILQIYQGVSSPCEILALKGGSWRKTDWYSRGSLLFFSMQFLAFVHAAFHWIGVSENYAVVISFSISNEVYGEIPFPEEMASLRDAIGITVLEGMLCAHSISYHQRKHTIKLWVLKEYGIKQSWIRFLSVEDPSTDISIPKYRFADGEVLFWCSDGVPFRTRSGPFGAWPQSDIVLDAHAFTESLISPRSLTY